MARINNLNSFLNDVAAAIKEKAGLTEITPADFDTAINGISTGIEPNGTIKSYYVGANQTINKGDFVELKEGIANLSTTITPWSCASDEATDAVVMQWMNERQFIVGYIGSDTHNLILGVIEDSVVKLYTTYTLLRMDTYGTYGGDIWKINDTDFVITYDMYAVFGRIINDTTIQFGMVDDLDGDYYRSTRFVHSSNGYTGVAYYAGKTGQYDIMFRSCLTVDTEANDFEIGYENGSNRVAISSTANFLSSNETSLRVKNAAYDRAILLFKTLSGKSLNDGEVTTVSGVYGANMPFTTASDNSYGYGNITLLQSGATFKDYIFPKTDSTVGWGIKQQNNASNSSLTDLIAYKITTGTKTVSMASSYTTLISGYADDFTGLQVCPLDATRTLITWVSNYLPSGDTYRCPMYAAVVTHSGSTISCGPMIKLTLSRRAYDDTDFYFKTTR